jgi:putative flippase GtrA
MGAVMAKLCATTVGLGWNFLINSGWTFRDAHDEVSG